MKIPILFFLYLYLMLLSIFVVFSFFLVYHAWRFGVATKTNIFTILLYLAGSSIILILSYLYIIGVDWQQVLVLF